MRNHGCGDERKTSGVPVWLPSPPPACIEIIDNDCDCGCDDWRDDFCDDWRDRRGCRRPRRRRPSCRPRRRSCCPPTMGCCPPTTGCCPPTTGCCPPTGAHCAPLQICPPPCPPPIERQLEFCVCVGSVCEITCVEVEVECVKVFQRDCQSCLWLQLCVTLGYRDRFCNNYTQRQSVCVELCDVPPPCGCCPPRVQVCGPPCAVIQDGQVCVSVPVRIC